MEFLGFPRVDGSVGTRNYLLVLPPGLIATSICNFVKGAKTLITPNFALSSTPRDRETVSRALIDLGRNPNLGAVVVHNGGNANDFEGLTGTRLARDIAASGNPVECIDITQEDSALLAIAKGIEVARKLVHQISRIKREPADLGKLAVGVKCGWSDSTSELAGNAAIGYLFDRIVEAGGVAMLGETVEVIGERLISHGCKHDPIYPQPRFCRCGGPTLALSIRRCRHACKIPLGALSACFLYNPSDLHQHRINIPIIGISRPPIGRVGPTSAFKNSFGDRDSQTKQAFCRREEIRRSITLWGAVFKG